MRTAILCVVLVLAGCSRQQPAPQKAQTTNVSLSSGPAAKPAKFKGSAATPNGIRTDVTAGFDGQYDIWFMDPAGDDMPAATLSNVSLEVAAASGAAKIPLAINDTGETWMGKGAVLNDAQFNVNVAFAWHGADYKTTVLMTPANAPLDYVCPMDHDVRSAVPGTCPRCGMKLVLGVPEADAFHVELKLSPQPLKPGQKEQISMYAEDPKSGDRVTKFETVHEKLWHFFVVGSDMKFFVHDHPSAGANGEFHLSTTFPHPGMYRVLHDFYPSGATPQLIPQTIFVPGPGADAPPVQLTEDIAPKKGENTGVELTLDPPRPVAGGRTRIILKLTPGDGLEKLLGAWAHMLAASNDLIDLIHEHPYSSDGATQILFDMRLPRAGIYRMWIQFQRKGVINTVPFNVPVAEQ